MSNTENGSEIRDRDLLTMPDLLPEEIPDGWQYSTVGSVSTNDGDYGSSASARDYHPDLPRYVRITDIQQDGTLDQESRTSITFEEADGHLLEEGDIVFARSGATVGKTYLYDPDDGVCAYAGYVIKYQIDSSKADPHYVHYWTKSPLYWRRVERTLRKGAQPNINASEYRGFELLLPPLPEQRRIADVLDTVDRAIQETDAVVRKQEQVKTGLLQDLLTRGLNADGRLRDPEREPEVFRETELGILPREWTTARFDEVAKLRHGFQFRSYHFSERGYPVVKIKNVAEDGTLDLSEVSLIPKEKADEFQDVELFEGDLLMSLTGNIGRVVKVPEVNGRLFQNYRVGRFSPRDSQKLSKDFLELVLSSSLLSEQVRRKSNKTAQANIGKGEFLETHLPIPPLHEQRKIAKRVQAQTKTIQGEKAYRGKLQSLKTGLMQDLLTGRMRVPEAEARVDEVVA
jgi:type I restriction enzyme S subunit